MPSYLYKARDKFGRPISGITEAESQNSVADQLKKLEYIPVSIKKQEVKTGLDIFFDRLNGVSFTDLNMFTRQFSAVQKAGLTIVTSLKSLREETVNRTFKLTLSQIVKDIEGGVSLSNALAKYPDTFDRLYVNMIAIGETSGTLDQILERLAILGEHDEKLRLKIKSATRYPIVVVLSIIIGFMVLTTLIVPRFAKLYAQYTTNLPLPTQILLTINFLITKLWWLIILVSAAFIFGFNKFIKTDAGKYWWDGFKLRVPIFGDIVLKLTMSRFARTTGTLVHSGVPILRVLELASSGAGNVIISKTILTIKSSVADGKGMTEPMKKSGIFTPLVIQMVSAGEGTGKLDELLLHVSDYYDSQVDYTINNLATLIEPILIVVLGTIVMFMALGLFLPMWNLMSLFKK